MTLVELSASGVGLGVPLGKLVLLLGLGVVMAVSPTTVGSRSPYSLSGRAPYGG